MLLATSNAAVAQVAKKRGFNSLKYFARKFWQRIRMTTQVYGLQ